jgi:toxin ParE1/3/4
LPKTDLEDIAYFIARENAERAKSFTDEIVVHCHNAATLSSVGRDRPEFGQSIRSIPHGRYIIFVE